MRDDAALLGEIAGGLQWGTSLVTAKASEGVSFLFRLRYYSVLVPDAERRLVHHFQRKQE